VVSLVLFVWTSGGHCLFFSTRYILANLEHIWWSVFPRSSLGPFVLPPLCPVPADLWPCDANSYSLDDPPLVGFAASCSIWPELPQEQAFFGNHWTLEWTRMATFWDLWRSRAALLNGLVPPFTGIQLDLARKGFWRREYCHDLSLNGLYGLLLSSTLISGKKRSLSFACLGSLLTEEWGREFIRLSPCSRWWSTGIDLQLRPLSHCSFRI
jgi:hypothetical protein